MTMEKVVRKVIELGLRRAEEEDSWLDELARKNGHSPDIFTARDFSVEDLERERPAADELFACLEDLPPSQIRKLEALMYAGRDDWEVVDAWRFLVSFHKDESHELAMYKLRENMLLDWFLEAGLELARSAGLDLDVPWSYDVNYSQSPGEMKIRSSATEAIPCCH